MLATVTDKGQVTVPKEIRDRLGIEPGVKLDFRIQPDGTLRVHVLRRGAAGLYGLLHRSGRPAVPVERMNEAVASHLKADDERLAPAGKARR